MFPPCVQFDLARLASFIALWLDARRRVPAPPGKLVDWPPSMGYRPGSYSAWTWRDSLEGFERPEPREKSGNDSLAHGVKNQLRHAFQFQFFHDVGPVRFHRIYAQMEEISHFLVGFPFGNQLQNLSFAWCQQIVGIFAARALQLFHIVFQHHLADRWAEKRLAFGHRSNGTHQV